MDALARRRSMGALGSLLMMASLLVAVGLPAAAVPQSNPEFPTVGCGGEWHWVHVQTTATAGTLTATFQNAGTIIVANGAPFESNNLHYTINLSSGDTLVAASDDVADGKLVLSHYPTCQTTTSRPTTTTSEGTTTTSEATTTTSGGTTTTSGGTTTTSGGTTTSAGATTTSAGATTTAGATSTQATSPQGVSSPTLTNVSVGGVQVSLPEAAQVVTQETLPFTGLSTPAMAALVTVLALAGVLLLVSSRQSEEAEQGRRWN